MIYSMTPQRTSGRGIHLKSEQKTPDRAEARVWTSAEVNRLVKQFEQAKEDDETDAGHVRRKRRQRKTRRLRENEIPVLRFAESNR